jgi:uncharacterized membrane protein
VSATIDRGKVEGAPSHVTQRHIDTLVHLRQRHEERKGRLARAADWLVAWLGTPQCVAMHLVLAAGWVLANTRQLPGVAPWDPYPFSLFSALASSEAIMLALLILITQNRQARLAERRADMDLHVSLLAEHETTRLIALTEAIAERVGVDAQQVAGGEEIADLKEVLQPAAVMRELERVEEEL